MDNQTKELPKTVTIEEATASQLRNFATVGMQLEMGPTTNGPTIISKLREAGFSGDVIPIIQVASPSDNATSFDRSVFEEEGRKYCRINIPANDKPGGQDPVPVGVNGTVIALPRGKDIQVPVEYVEVLKNAVAYHYKPFTGFKPDGSMDLGGLNMPDKVSEFPFNTVGA